MMIFEQDDPAQLRSYQEKRDLVGQVGYAIKRFDDPFIVGRVADYMARMADIFRPFDYGRFEFRVDHATGDVRLLEVNLNCNLWRSEEHTSELQSLMRNSYAVFFFKKKKTHTTIPHHTSHT